MWKDLTLSQKADIIKMAVKQGMRSINDIQSFYDEVSGNSERFKDGGNLFEGTTKDSQQMQFGPAYWQQQVQKPIFTEELAEFNRKKAEEDKQRRVRFQRWAETKGKEMAEKRARDYTTTSNDNTWVEKNNGRTKNPHLADRAERGAKAYRAWVEEHPISNAVGLGLSTIPFVVAASPILAPAGEAFAGTTLAGISAPMWTDAALTAGFAAHGLDHAINEGINGWGDAAMTALEVAPLGRLAKPMYNTAVKTGNTLYNDVYVPYKIANTINKGVKENAVITAYNRNPATKDIGSLWDYQYYLDNVFPNSKVKDVLWHGSINKNLQTFSPEYIGSNTPIKKSMGMYLAPERATAANYGKKGGVYPVLLNTENPFITNQFFGGISKNGVNVTKISPEVKNTLLANNDAVIAPKRGELAFFNPDNALILGSDADVTGFRRFMSRPQVPKNFLTK